MKTSLCLELDEESNSHAFLLPMGSCDLPPGTPIPAKGERVCMTVFRAQSTPALLEPREFEVIERNFWFNNDFDTRELTRVEVTLTLRDLGSTMLNEQGFGALGKDDPVLRRRPLKGKRS